MTIRFLPTGLALAGLLTLLSVNPAVAAGPAADKDGGPLPVGLFPGARVVERSTRDFDDYWFALGKLKGDGQAEKVELVGGSWTHIALTIPAGGTVAGVFRHYEQQVARAGLEVLYSCKGVECGEGGRKTNGDWWPLSENRRYLAARLRRRQGYLWVSVHVHARSATAPVEHELDIVEGKPPVAPPSPRDEADVATLARELKTDGHVVLR